MNTEQILAEIREANLSYLMLAQSLIRADREQALFRLGISDGSMTELMMAPDSPAAAVLRADAEVIVGTQSTAPRAATGPRFSF